MKLVVDKMLTGWKDLREEELLKNYEEIRRVGKTLEFPNGRTISNLGSTAKRMTAR
jgi:hypothetical protein